LFAVNPRVTQLPHSQPVATGKEVTFRVETRGSGFAFQWQKDDSSLHDDNRYHGTNTDTLCIQQVEKNDKGLYRVVLKKKNNTKENLQEMFSL